MPITPHALTKRQITQVEKFLRTFTDVEMALKKRLHKPVSGKDRISDLIDSYAAKNPYWRETADRLWIYKDIRNFITHYSGTNAGYPVAVTLSALQNLTEIAQSLENPCSVSEEFRKKVISVSNADSLAEILGTAYDCGFSQFPVINAGKFGGLITESEIVRWLGRQARENKSEVNLATAKVKDVLKEKDPFMQGIAGFRFAMLSDPLDEVMARFATEQALEVIFLTKCGKNHSQIEGIVTQWDAARYAN